MCALTDEDGYHLFFIYAGSNYLRRRQSYHLVIDVEKVIDVGVACNLLTQLLLQKKKNLLTQLLLFLRF